MAFRVMPANFWRSFAVLRPVPLGCLAAYIARRANCRTSAAGMIAEALFPAEGK
jgi:hypothetical protein